MNGNMSTRVDRAIIYRSEIDFISRCILDYLDIETGGQLFGFWTAGGIPVVLYAIGPGANANHQVSFFNQDIGYLEQVGRKLFDKYGLKGTFNFNCEKAHKFNYTKEEIKERKNKERSHPNWITPLFKNGGYLLSHKRSTIGAVGLNFSVRNGKRWNPDTITT